MNMPRTAAVPLRAIVSPASPARKTWQILAGASMVTAVFVLSNSASPLYPHWQAQFGFSAGTLTVIFAAYIAGLLGALLLAGQLSDRMGRKAVLFPGFLIAMAACGLFMTAWSVASLMAARFLSGVAVGIIVSAGMAAVVDLGGQDRKRQASQAASIAMVLGAGLGPLLAGTLALWIPDPVPAIFAIELVLLAIATGVMFALPLPHAHGKLADQRQRLRLRLPSVPAQNRRELALGIAVFAPGLTATSFVLSLGPALLSNLLHVRSPLVTGGMAFLMFASAAGAQMVVNQQKLRTVLLTGSAATVLSMAALAGAIHASSAALLLAAAALAGVGQGLGQLGGLSAIAMKVPDQQRAQANSLLNFGAYIPAGLLPVATGFLIDQVGLKSGSTIFAVVLVFISLIAAYFIFGDKHE